MKPALQSVLHAPWEQEPVCLINQRGVEPDNADTVALMAMVQLVLQP